MYQIALRDLAFSPVNCSVRRRSSGTFRQPHPRVFPPSHHNKTRGFLFITSSPMGGGETVVPGGGCLQQASLLSAATPLPFFFPFRIR